MTALAGSPPQRIALGTAAFSIVLLLPTAAAAWLDPRTLNDIGVWIKPLKFEVSLALHWITLAWLLGCLATDQLERPGIRRAMVIGGVATAAEVLYIVLQAARGRASHFNFDTRLEAVLYHALMGGGALVLVGTAAWLGWRIWRHPAGGVRNGLWLGAVLGLVGGSLVTLVVTMPLSSGIVAGPGHWVGGVRSDAGGLPIVGWSTTGGDLRVPHFFATHLVQVLPAIGWLADRLRPRAARASVWLGAGLGVAVVGATLLQAIGGRSFATLWTGA